MKTKMLISYSCLFIILCLLSVSLRAQKYSTQAGYEKYFVDNFKQLDNIEGIWKKVLQARVTGSNDLIGEQAKVNVAIIYEGTDNSGNKIFSEYQLINGRYDPSMAVAQYLKHKDFPTKYLFSGNKNDSGGVSYASSPFYLRTGSNSFEYEIIMSDHPSSATISSVTVAISSYKAFPFEGDISR